MCVLSCIQFFRTTWTIAHQTPRSLGFPRQGYQSGLSFPTPGDLPDSGINPHLLCLLPWQADCYHWTTKEVPSYFWFIGHSPWVHAFSLKFYAFLHLRVIIFSYLLYYFFPSIFSVSLAFITSVRQLVFHFS